MNLSQVRDVHDTKQYSSLAVDYLQLPSNGKIYCNGTQEFFAFYDKRQCFSLCYFNIMYVPL